MSFVFNKAVKTGSRARLGLIGPYGSGKTFTALTIARGFGGRVGLVDTERRRALLYSDVFDFHHLPVERFDPRDLTAITIAAAEQGVGTLIIDSWTPYWSGVDGMLDQVGKAARDFEGWKTMRPVEREMLDAVMGFPGNVIVTIRTKMAYEVRKGADNKTEIERLGTKPEQREGIEYELDMVATMQPGTDGNPTMTFTKSMCPELRVGHSIYKPDEQVSDTITKWLERDAVGEPLNPHTVAAWACDDARTIEDLRIRWEELDGIGQLGAVVANPYSTDPAFAFVTIGDLIRLRRRQIDQAAKRAAATAPDRELAGAAS